MCMKFVFFALFLGACAVTWTPNAEFAFVPVAAGGYDIATYQKTGDTNSPIHIYIEGDGHAFDVYGMPTDDPTPRGTMMRDLAMRDSAANVAYIARPCQFIMSQSCNESDWTDGRFSEKIIDAMSSVVRRVAGARPIVLVGYSGGAMVSGLIIARNPKLKVQEWVTIGGVLNHHAWTEYFGDAPLTKSLDLEKMPNVSSRHFVGTRDRVVPMELTRHAVGGAGRIIEIPGAGHADFAEIDVFGD